MTPFIALPNAQAPVPPQTSAVVGAATNVSPVNLPIDAVPATVTNQQINNNLKGGSSPARSAAPTSTPISTGGSFLNILMPANTSAPVQFSSPFLAQLFAQTPSSQVGSLASFFANDNVPTSTLDSELMQLFSEVKYRPSNAAKPMPPTQNVLSSELSQDGVERQRQQIQQQAQSTTRQVVLESSDGNRQGVNTQASALSASQAPARSVQATPARPTQPQQQTSEKSPVKRLASLIRPVGLDAYVASFSRNVANLTPTSSESVSASF